MRRIVSVFSAIFAISAGILVLLGYFVRIDPLPQVRDLLIDWAVIIAGAAVFVGILNLIMVHMEKIRTRQKGAGYGALLVISLFFTAVYGVVFGPEDPLMRLSVDAVIIPVEGTLMALLAVTLIYASIRLLRRRVDIASVIFLAVALAFLIAVVLIPIIPVSNSFLQFLAMFSRGGARGLLIGIALGTLLTGLRVLFGADRPYGGN